MLLHRGAEGPTCVAVTVVRTTGSWPNSAQAGGVFAWYSGRPSTRRRPASAVRCTSRRTRPSLATAPCVVAQPNNRFGSGARS